jgi:hypothetical protein
MKLAHPFVARLARFRPIKQSGGKLRAYDEHGGGKLRPHDEHAPDVLVGEKSPPAGIATPEDQASNRDRGNG